MAFLWVVFHANESDPPGEVVDTFATEAEAREFIEGPGDGHGYSMFSVQVPPVHAPAGSIFDRLWQTPTTHLLGRQARITRPNGYGGEEVTGRIIAYSRMPCYHVELPGGHRRMVGAVAATVTLLDPAPLSGPERG